MCFLLVMLFMYKIESGEMQIIRQSGREVINFYGGVVVRDTDALITSPAALYYQKEGVMDLSGPVSGFQGGRNLRCRTARIYENDKTFKGYGNCEIEGIGEYLKCDSVILSGDQVIAFGDVFLKSDKDSIEAGGQVLYIKENYLKSSGNSFLKYPGEDSLVLFSKTYTYKDSVLNARGAVNIFSREFEGSCDSLLYMRNSRIAYLIGNGAAKNSTNLLKGDTILVFLTEGNRMDSSIALSKASLLNQEKGNELFLEGDTLLFYSEKTDSLKWFRAYNVKGYYKEGAADGNP